MSNLEIILVEGGTFMMGSESGYKDEAPHEVTLSLTFILSNTL